VRAAILSNPETRDVDITAKADEGVVTISGKAKTQDVIDLINEIVTTVSDVKEVRNNVELDYRYQHIE